MFDGVVVRDAVYLRGIDAIAIGFDDPVKRGELASATAVLDGGERYNTAHVIVMETLKRRGGSDTGESRGFSIPCDVHYIY